MNKDNHQGIWVYIEHTAGHVQRVGLELLHAGRELKAVTGEEMREMGVVNEVVPFEKLEERAMEVARQVARIPAESMGMMKHAIRKMYDIRGFSNTLDYCAEMFNLSRTNMQKKEMGEFRDAINQGGLKAALYERYN